MNRQLLFCILVLSIGLLLVGVFQFNRGSETSSSSETEEEQVLDSFNFTPKKKDRNSYSAALPQKREDLFAKQREVENARALTDFRQHANQVLNRLPTKAQIQAKYGNTGDLHRPPKELFAASEPLGSIAEKMKKNPMLVNEGMRFYERCAASSVIMLEVRAVCLKNMREWAKKPSVSYPAAYERSFSRDVEELASRI